MGLSPTGMKSCDGKACSRSSDTRNEAGRTSSVRYEVVQKGSLSSSVRYEESSMWNFVHLVQSRVIEELVLVCLIRGIKHAGLRPSCTKSRKERLSTSFRYEVSSRRDYIHPVRSRTRRACPRLFSMRYQASGISFVRCEVARKESLSSSVRYEE